MKVEQETEPETEYSPEDDLDDNIDVDRWNSGELLI